MERYEYLSRNVVRTSRTTVQNSHSSDAVCRSLLTARRSASRTPSTPSGSSVVALARFWTSYIKVSSPHGRLLVLPCLPPFLHTFCTLSARRLCAAPPGSGAGLTSSQTSPRKWHYGPRPPRPCLARPSHATPALMCKKLFSHGRVPPYSLCSQMGCMRQARHLRASVPCTSSLAAAADGR